MPYCPRCGSYITDDNAKFCPSRGQELPATVQAPTTGTQMQPRSEPKPESKPPQQQGQAPSPSFFSAEATRPPPFPSVGGRYATVGERFAAILIDLVILVLVAAVIAIPFGIAVAFERAAFGFPFRYFFFGRFDIVWFILWMIYFTYFESKARNGQTIGKRAISIRVVDRSTGHTIDFGRSLIRSVARVVDWLPFFYIIGFILLLITSKKQRLGDLAAKTVVIKA